MKALACLLALAGSLTLTATSAVAADATKGREVFVKAGCWSCHGFNGQGGNAGPRIAPDPMAPDTLASFIRNADKTTMPPYTEKNLSNDDVANIHAWLASQPKPKNWKEIPQLAP